MNAGKQRVEDHIGLAKTVANDFARMWDMGFEDVYGWALYWLWHATEKFEPERGFAFSTFAMCVIKRGVCMDYQKERDLGRDFKPRSKKGVTRSLDFELEGQGRAVRLGGTIAAADDGRIKQIDDADELDDFLTLITCREQMAYIEGVARGMTNAAIAAGAGKNKSGTKPTQQALAETTACPVANTNGRMNGANLVARMERARRAKARKATA